MLMAFKNECSHSNSYSELGSVELSHLTGIFFVNAVLKSSCSFVYTAVFRASFLETLPSATKSQQNLAIRVD